MAVAPQVIQLKRRIGGASGAPNLAQLEEGEPAYNNNGHTLHISDGSQVQTLVSASRQLELTGAQTVTTGTANAKTFDLTNLLLLGGDEGQVLKTAAANGELEWGDALADLVVDAPLEGEGTADDHLRIQIATEAEIQAGSDNVKVVTAAGLRTQLGAANTAIDSNLTATTVVPAINEIFGLVQALSGALILQGSWDPNDDEVTPGSGPGVGHAGGNLVAPAEGNKGWYFIVDTAGEGTSSHAPTGPYKVGDWLISTGEEWMHLQLNLDHVVAEGVAITTITDMTGVTNVQNALEFLMEKFGDYLPLAGGTVTGNVSMTGSAMLTLAANGTANLHAVTVQQLNAAVEELETTLDEDFLKLAGGQMAGNITFSAATNYIRMFTGYDPSDDYDVVTKKYIEDYVDAEKGVVDDVTIQGAGTTASPWHVATVDGGTF